MATLTPGDKRGEVLEVEGAILVNDCYNSNPQALDSMVRALGQTPAKRRVVIAGEMLELGPMARACITSAAATWPNMAWTIVVGVRGNGAQHRCRARARPDVPAEFVETPEEAGRLAGP